MACCHGSVSWNLRLAALPGSGNPTLTEISKGLCRDPLTTTATRGESSIFSTNRTANVRPYHYTVSMQILALELSHFNFFCPVTGQRISAPGGYQASPAQVGLWLGGLLGSSRRSVARSCTQRGRAMWRSMRRRRASTWTLFCSRSSCPTMPALRSPNLASAAVLTRRLCGMYLIWITWRRRKG
jgi:hypothetical protein